MVFWKFDVSSSGMESDFDIWNKISFAAYGISGFQCHGYAIFVLLERISVQRAISRDAPTLHETFASHRWTSDIEYTFSAFWL